MSSPQNNPRSFTTLGAIRGKSRTILRVEHLRQICPRAPRGGGRAEARAAREREAHALAGGRSRLASGLSASATGDVRAAVWLCLITGRHPCRCRELTTAGVACGLSCHPGEDVDSLRKGPRHGGERGPTPKPETHGSGPMFGSGEPRQPEDWQFPRVKSTHAAVLRRGVSVRNN